MTDSPVKPLLVLDNELRTQAVDLLTLQPEKSSVDLTKDTHVVRKREEKELAKAKFQLLTSSSSNLAI